MGSEMRIEPGRWVAKFDESGKYESADYSDSYRKMIGITKKDVENMRLMDWKEILHPDDVERVIAYVGEVFSKHPEGMDYDIEYRMNTKWGYHLFHDCAFCTRKDDGTMIRCEGVLFDVQSIVNMDDDVEKFVENVASKYDFAYEVNMKDDTFDLFQKRKEYLDVEYAFTTFTEVKNNFVNYVVHPADSARVRKEMEYDSIKKELANNKYFRSEFRVLIDGISRWNEMIITRISEDIIGIAFVNKDQEITKRRLEEKRYGEYYVLFEIDLDTGNLKVVKNEYGLNIDSEKAIPYLDFIQTFAYELEAESKEFFMQMSDIDFLKKEFEEDDKRTYSYKSMRIAKGKWIDVTLYVILRHEDGTPAMVSLGFSIVDTMTTIRREQQKQLKDALDKAESANRAKSTFLFNMSHDIRTPMNAILGYTNIALLHSNDEERVRDSLRKIKISGGHLLSLINDVLEMSRIEAGKFELQCKPLDIREVVRSVEVMSRSLAIPKSIDFKVDMTNISNPYVCVDELRMNQALINIISNAIKYSKEGGKVTCRVEQIGDVLNNVARYRFEIADKGIGMSEEFIGHIFETFSRENSSTVSRLEGAGLGLSIVKRIVEMVEGTIDIESKRGEGTTVTMEIPMNILDDSEIIEFKNTLIDDLADTKGINLLEGKKVLLVEDNEMNREIGEELLAEAGIITESAEDGAIALRMVEEKGIDYYDFILMDIQMPVMDGYEASRRIRKKYPDSDIPIIAVSANAFEEDRRASKEAGMDAHIAKPIYVDELYLILSCYA